MYRWAWLEDKIRRRPWIGLVILCGLLGLCVWILVSAPNDKSPRNGMPMWLFALVGIALFGYAGAMCVQEIRRRRKRRRA